jgi:hypothetical protein
MPHREVGLLLMVYLHRRPNPLATDEELTAAIATGLEHSEGAFALFRALQVSSAFCGYARGPQRIAMLRPHVHKIVDAPSSAGPAPEPSRCCMSFAPSPRACSRSCSST